DHVRQGKKAAVPNDETHEILHKGRSARLVEDRGEGAALLIGAENRAADEAKEILALVQHGTDTVEIASHGVECALRLRQFEEGCRITACHARDGMIR